MRSAEAIPCPCCEGVLFSVVGTRKRKVKCCDGSVMELSIRRLRCQSCRTIHHELPDICIPYKHYESAAFEACVQTRELLDLPVEEQTIRRWRAWFWEWVDIWLFHCTLIMERLSLDIPAKHLLSKGSLPALHRIGQVFGKTHGWLAKIVRLLVNQHFWQQTRFASLSTL